MESSQRAVRFPWPSCRSGGARWCRLSLLAAAIVSCAGAFAQETIDWDAYSAPDRRLVPGVLNPQVRQDNIQQTICVAGWTKTIRPPSSYTQRLEQQQIREWGLPGDPKLYHEDHLVPLCVGGHPDAAGNLWPSPVLGTWTDKVKDQLEASVCRAVCRGAMTLEEGQSVFMREPDWRKAYSEFFSDKPR